MASATMGMPAQSRLHGERAFMWNRFLLVRRCRALLFIALFALSPAALATPAVVISPPTIDFGVQPGSPFGNQHLTDALTAGLLSVT
jgi:hypothetical protein